MTQRAKPESLTDDGNGRRFVAQHGDDVRFVPVWGWLFYDGKRWRRDDCGEIHRRAKRTARAIWNEQSAAKDDDERLAIARHARKSQSAGAVDAMIKMASTESEIIALPDEFDRDPWLYNVQNGTLELQTTGTEVTLREHRRADYITKLATVAYDPEAKCPRFDQFLQEVFAKDVGRIGFVQRGAGYSLTGLTTEQKFLLLEGDGANGKGALIRTMEAWSGDYFKQADFSSFVERRNDGPKEDIAELAGARIVAASESRDGRKLAEGLLKTLTGQDTFSARFLHRDRFTFRPAFKLWLSSNGKPKVSGTDHGIWRRICLIPFTVTIAEDQVDDTLEPTIQGPELPGVLAWAVRGCLEWQRTGLGVPASVRDATNEYRLESDTFASFLAECCTLDKDARESASALSCRYNQWAPKSEQLSERAFSKRLTDKGFGAIRDSKTGRVHRIGLRLVTEGSEASEGKNTSPPENNSTRENVKMPSEPSEPSANGHRYTNGNDPLAGMIVHEDGSSELTDERVAEILAQRAARRITVPPDEEAI